MHWTAIPRTSSGFVQSPATVPEIDLVAQCPEEARSVGEYLSRQFRRGSPGRVNEATDSRLIDLLFAPPLQKAA